jgi:hypothetical protein
MRDVGDRDPHPGAAARPVLDAQRVVEVTGGLGVDGAEAAVAQVDAVGAVRAAAGNSIGKAAIARIFSISVR